MLTKYHPATSFDFVAHAPMDWLVLLTCCFWNALRKVRIHPPTQQCQWQPRLRAERRRWSFASLAMGGKMQEDELYLFAFM